MKFVLVTAAVFLSFCFINEVSAQTKRRVSFSRDSSGATVKGIVRGYEYRDYVIRADAGQTLEINLTAQKIVPVFTVFLPGGENLEKAAQVNDFSGALPISGDYVIRVGIMRAFARRKNSVSSYVLKINVY